MKFEVGKTYRKTECYGCGYDAGTTEIEYEIVKKNDTTIWYKHGLDVDENGEYCDKVHRAKLDCDFYGNECFNLTVTYPGVYFIDGSRSKEKRGYFADAKYDRI